MALMPSTKSIYDMLNISTKIVIEFISKVNGLGWGKGSYIVKTFWISRKISNR